MFFQEVDIDAMLKYSSIDELMKALAVGKAKDGKALDDMTEDFRVFERKEK